ncbi:MAG: hypothetical protein AAF913_08700 [Pseudomonadota bacterium]
MRVLALIPALALTACVTVPAAGPPPTGAGEATTVTWKTGTTRSERQTDRYECELAARGLGFDATEEQIADATNLVGLEQIEAFSLQCLSRKGYTIAEGRVCTADQIVRGQLLTGVDVLPPLETVRCFVPEQGGFVV